jgi:hypothetical protein
MKESYRPQSSKPHPRFTKHYIHCNERVITRKLRKSWFSELTKFFLKIDRGFDSMQVKVERSVGLYDQESK